MTGEGIELHEDDPRYERVLELREKGEWHREALQEIDGKLATLLRPEIQARAAQAAGEAYLGDRP